MKIEFPIEALLAQVKKMGAIEREFSLDVSRKEPLPPIVTTAKGIDVPLHEVNTESGLLSYNGAQVVLYIPDHGQGIDPVLEDGSKGRKVHVADCITLDQMRQKNRFQRYRAVVNVTGDFEIFGYSKARQEPLELTARLNVCINCLKHLNYKGYVTEPDRQRNIRSSFNLKDFFAEHSTLFRYLPTSFIERKTGYADDWQAVSERYRASKFYCCESCNIQLKEHKYLLHAHHIDGNKRNNQLSNLMALCADCHRKQPLHDSMSIKARDMSLLQRLRREQGVLSDAANWDDLFALVDPPYQGVLRFYQKDGAVKPVIGYEIRDATGAVVAEVGIAWPDAKFAVAGNRADQKILAALGWKVLSLEAALRGFRDGKS